MGRRKGETAPRRLNEEGRAAVSVGAFSHHHLQNVSPNIPSAHSRDDDLRDLPPQKRTLVEDAAAHIISVRPQQQQQQQQQLAILKLSREPSVGNIRLLSLEIRHPQWVAEEDAENTENIEAGAASTRSLPDALLITVAAGIVGTRHGTESVFGEGPISDLPPDVCSLLLSLSRKGIVQTVASWGPHGACVAVAVYATGKVVLEWGQNWLIHTLKRDALTEWMAFLALVGVVDADTAEGAAQYLTKQQGAQAVPGKVLYDATRDKLNQGRPHQQNPAMLSELRPYQLKAVAWMLEMEKGGQITNPFWERVAPSTAHPGALYVNRVTGCLSATPPIPCPHSGGILSDEMGLGKTVELIACILDNRRVLPPSLPLPMDQGPDAQQVPPQAPAQQPSQPPPVLFCTCGAQTYEPAEVVVCESCNRAQHPGCVSFDAELEGERFVCMDCLAKRPPLPSRATIIVSPASIALQWQKEIEKHVQDGELKVLFYEGVRKRLYRPQQLCGYDVVITTYEVLSPELLHAKHETNERSLRGASRRFCAAVSPLPLVEWWRACLDEAQMVESTTTQASAMAARLPSVHRWCITGTPCAKGLSDMFGLVHFLGVLPFAVETWWDAGMRDLRALDAGRLYESPLMCLLQRLFWRTEKSYVLDELHIPPQHQATVAMRLNPIERYFYDRLNEDCRDQTLALLNKLCAQLTPETSLSALDRRDQSKVLAPLLHLRQACCHPNVAKGGHLLKSGLQDMDSVLAQMISKAQIACAEHFRSLAYAKNGLAGVAVLVGNLTEAARTYKWIIDRYSYYATEHLFDMDHFQMMHALANLIDVLAMLAQGGDGGSSSAAEAIPADVAALHAEVPALTDRVAALQDKFTLRAEANVTAVKNDVDELTAKADLHVGKRFIELFAGWQHPDASHVVERLRQELIEASTAPAAYGGLAAQFYTPGQLKYVLVNEWDKITEARKVVMKKLMPLVVKPSKKHVQEAAECPMCRPRGQQGDKHGQVCSYCEITDLLMLYEPRIFRDVTLTVGNVDFVPKQDSDSKEIGDLGGEFTYLKQRRPLEVPTQGPCEFERILRFLRHSITNGDDEALHEAFGEMIALMETLKKEFMQMRALWIQLWDRVSVLDELAMCTLRIRQRVPGMHVPAFEEVMYIDDPEIERIRLTADVQEEELVFGKMKGRLTYLNSLSEQSKKGETPQCPICFGSLDHQYAIFECGHCYCMDCTSHLTSSHAHARFPCSVCKEMTSKETIEHVCVRQATADADAIPINGNHSTKISEIVRRLKTALAASEKTIVFSQWTDVLELIARASKENDISVVQGWGTKFQTEVNRFKTDASANVLLLPMNKGAQGLNLTEAQNVFLVEPCIDPGTELQAISRVHRIGQTKETRVFRFLILESVEEQVISLSQAKFVAAASGDGNPAASSAVLSSPKKGATANLQQEMKQVTVGELEKLFRIKRTQPTQQRDGDVVDVEGGVLAMDEGGDAPTAFPSTSFWAGRVVYHGRECSREEALVKIAAAHSAVARQGGAPSGEPNDVVVLYGKTMKRSVQMEVLTLPRADESM